MTFLSILALAWTFAAAPADDPPRANLALVATPSTSFVSGHETLGALNDGSTPEHSDDKSKGAYGNWPRNGTQWVQYEWARPVSAERVEVYWFDDRRGVRLPRAARLLMWDGKAFVPVPGASEIGRERNRFNASTFPAVVTTRLRLEIDSEDNASTGVLEWRVIDSGASPNFAPTVTAGVDRVAVLGGATYLDGHVRDDGKPTAAPKVRWSKQSGPGEVTFDDSGSASTAARFAAPGHYVLALAANDGESSDDDTLEVSVVPGFSGAPLEPVATTPYRVSGRFWTPRMKAVVVRWIPHCIGKINDPQTAEGGIDNFLEAARKLAGATDARHKGYVFSNAWVHNTVEAICLALMLDAQGDPEIAAAQAAMRQTLEDWIPKILAAQEPDGYLHTQYTIRGQRRWSNKGDHEGYTAGYFLEAAIAHHRLTEGKDARLYDAARRLADCWVQNIGPPPKRPWYEGHQAFELALVKFAAYVEEREGPGKGAAYVALARHLLDMRGGGEEYDQSHVPVTHQYEAVGHAVRAVYSYTGMADIAMLTGDVDYQSAVRSLWSNLVDRKLYITGGVGSGETAEGFGGDYSLPNRAYCESCAGCGELFFQHRMNRADHEARYADLYEDTLYNAILGGLDLEGANFTYTNALDSGERRYGWHVCPCCVGNLPRTLLSLPTWMYARGPESLTVNLFAGSTVRVGPVAGTPVEVVQVTDYPWSEHVGITLNPAEPRTFRLRVRVPARDASRLYTLTPPSQGIAELAVNGEAVPVKVENGYAVIDREWKAGDQVRFRLPMEVQRIRASEKVEATRGRVALRYGPLIYNLESVDQDLGKSLAPDAPLQAVRRDDLLGGVLAITGTFADGSPLLAIPNYARLNRGGRSIVWIAQP